MIHFLEPGVDDALAADLRDAGLLDPGLCARIEEALGHPEVGTLDEYLLAGAEWIPEKRWLAWLIRRHGCHRFGPILGCEDARELARGRSPADANLPYRRCPGGALLVAVLRPDRREATMRAYPRERILWAAASLSEMRSLRQRLGESPWEQPEG